MLIRQTPKNLEKYIKVDSIIGEKLQTKFIPLYMDNEYLYFEKSQELEDYLKVVNSSE